DRARERQKLRTKVEHFVAHAAGRVDDERHVERLATRELTHEGVVGGVVLLVREGQEARAAAVAHDQAVLGEKVVVPVVVPGARRENPGRDAALAGGAPRTRAGCAGGATGPAGGGAPA